MNTKAIIFDLDGTLLDTLQDLYASVNHALTHFSLPNRSKTEVRQFLGNGVRRLIELSMPEGSDAATTEAVLAEFKTYYLQHSLDTTRPYDGIEEMLGKCREMGLKTAIVSNKLNPAVQDLRHRFFADNVDIAIGETREIRRKPAPDMLQAVMEELKVTNCETIYVGDSEVDLQTAKNASTECIAVAWGFRGRKFLEQQGATTIIDNPSELIQHLA